MRNILLVVAVVAMSFWAAAGEKNAPAKDAAAKSRATVRKRVLPGDLENGVVPLNFPVNFKGRMNSFFGYDLGLIVNPPAEPKLNRHGDFILTGKLKKPFRRCTQGELIFSGVSHALYSIRLFSPPQKKRMTDAENLQPINFKTKLKRIDSGVINMRTVVIAFACLFCASVVAGIVCFAVAGCYVNVEEVKEMVAWPKRGRGDKRVVAISSPQARRWLKRGIALCLLGLCVHIILICLFGLLAYLR